MKKNRIVILIIAIMLIAVQLCGLNYSSLSWSDNSGRYLGIISMILIILSIVFSHRYDKRHRAKQ